MDPAPHQNTPQVIDKCAENNINLVSVPKHCTNTCQPLDVGVFGPVKSAMKARLTDLRRIHGKAGVDYKYVIGVFVEKWKEFSSENVSKAFKTATNLT